MKSLILILAVTVTTAMFVMPHIASAQSHEPELCVTDLCDPDLIRDVLLRNMNRRVEVVLTSGERLTGNVSKITGRLVQLSNLKHKDFFDAVIELDAISAVIMRVRTRKDQ